MSNKKFRVTFLAIALGVVVLGASFGSGLITFSGGESASAESLVAMTAEASTAADLESPFKAVYENVSQSVVGIQLTVQRSFGYGRIDTQSEFVGSGVVISEDGHVVTNYHVVTGGGTTVASDISVVYNDETYSAKYVAGDEEGDVAVLQVDGLNAPAVALGNSDELSVGDWALVVGNPLGESFTNTLTVGVISGLNREVSSNSRIGSGTTLIQTDAAINSGNSGGGLFNIRGELVGITSSKMSNNGLWGSASIEGIGLAIPINTVVEIADDLIDYGMVLHPRIGVTVRTMDSPSEEPSSEYLPKSVLVDEVEEGSPAERAGIQAYDLIMEVDGERVTTTDEMTAIIRSHQAGETVEITVYRIPKLSTIKVDEDIPEGEYLTFTVDLELLDKTAETN